MKVIRVRFLVMESSGDFEQALRLRKEPGLPPQGVLDWRSGRAATLFGSRKLARAAIERTEHYRLAFGAENWPEKKCCKVIAVQEISE